MTGTSVLYMLLGAALVAVGVLASALADRIRGLRSSRDGQQIRSPREKVVSAPRAAIPVVEAAEPVRAAPIKSRPVRVEQKATRAEEGGEDVIAALVGSGFKKATAAEATWACTAPERATIEGWTAAALRRARGGLS